MEPRQHNQTVDGFDLVVEGMQSDDPRLARTAAANARYLLPNGARPVPNWREILETHLGRFPQLSGPARFMLHDLDDAETKGYVL